MSKSSVSLGIVGARGHTGSELIRLVQSHPAFELAFVSSRELAGQRVADHNDGYAGELRFEHLDADAVAAKAADAVILALPNGKAPDFVAALDATRPATVIVDLSADHRFDDRWYYGLPELTRANGAGQTRISNPGCYATAMQLAIAPVLDRLAGPPQCFGVSGYSGAGTTPSDRNNIELLRDNLMPYSLADHLHEREVSRRLGVPVEFMPHVAPHFRGICLTANLWLNDRMALHGAVEGGLTVGADLGRGVEMDRGWGVHADPGVAVLVVVVGEELLGERAGVGQGPEAVGEDRGVLQGLERRLAVGVVVGHVRSGVGAGHAEVDEQLVAPRGRAVAERLDRVGRTDLVEAHLGPPGQQHRRRVGGVEGEVGRAVGARSRRCDGGGPRGSTGGLGGVGRDRRLLGDVRRVLRHRLRGGVGRRGAVEDPPERTDEGGSHETMVSLDLRATGGATVDRGHWPASPRSTRWPSASTASARWRITGSCPALGSGSAPAGRSSSCRRVARCPGARSRYTEPVRAT